MIGALMAAAPAAGQMAGGGPSMSSATATTNVNGPTFGGGKSSMSNGEMALYALLALLAIAAVIHVARG